MGKVNLVKCFGKNTVGQADVPAEFASDVAGMSAGRAHTCMWKTDLLKCFGANG